MKYRTVTLILSLAAALLAATANAAERDNSEPFRPCQPADIEGGTFRMLDFVTEYEYKPTDAHFQPHQFFVFGKDVSFRHFTSGAPLSDGEIFAHLQLSNAPNSTYAMSAASVITVKYPSHTGYYFCTAITGDAGRKNEKGAPIYESGDILLSEGDEKNKIVKRLRRVVPLDVE